METRVRPMSPTKMALIENIVRNINDLLKEIEDLEKNRSQDENIVSMLKASVEVFSESISDFKFLEINDQLFLLAQRVLKSGLILMRLLKKNLKKELTPEINDVLKKSGLISVG